MGEWGCLCVRRKIATFIVLMLLLTPVLIFTPVPQVFAADADESQAIVIPDREYTTEELNQQEEAEEIEPGETPMAGGTYINPAASSSSDYSGWSLLNLILAVTTAVMSAVLLHLQARKKDSQQKAFRVYAIAATIFSFVLLDATQNISLPMGFADIWSPGHAVITASVAMVLIIAAKSTENVPGTENV